jgi:peptide/nickel transport system permease protein
MTTYVVRKLLQVVPLLFGVSLLTFLIIHTAPGDPVSYIMAPGMSGEEAEQMRRNLGLDQPVCVQYVLWLGAILRGDLGISFLNNRPVLDLVWERIPATLLLSGAALLYALILCIPIGIISAVRQYSLFDNLSTLFVFLGYSLPGFWLGLMLLYLFSVQLKWLPAGGMTNVDNPGGLDDVLKHLILPAVVLGTFVLANLVRFLRSSLLEVLHEDYVRTARAKGVAERRVLTGHALRNALIPVVTVLGVQIPVLLSGALITETIFSWPGIGRLAVRSAFERDYPMIMGLTLMVSALVVLSNLITDVAYGYLDPRIRLS